MRMTRFLDLPTQIDRLELTKLVVAACLLLSIVTVSLFHIQMQNPPRPEKLVVVALSRPYVDEEATLRVAVVNEEGTIVENRDDLIEVSILTKGISIIGVEGNRNISWVEKLQIRLRDGEAHILFRSLDEEAVTIIARQIEGATPLDETRVTFVAHSG